jgi:hypothetical protein
MNYRLSRHAESEVERRQIPQNWLNSLLDEPQQRIRQNADTEIWQSRFAGENGKCIC